jgi:multimeric flavodoxin WrbA
MGARQKRGPVGKGDIMRIVVINGSPKGDMSVTMQYLEYIRRNNPNKDFKIFNVGHDIKKIEKKPELFTEIVQEIGKSDGILWCFPVYVLLVPSQLKRFVELIFENSAEEAFKDKYATALTTSAHIYDHTAHNYIRAISEDLGTRFVDGYSAEMYDLLKENERKSLLDFAADFFSYIESNRPTQMGYSTVSYDIPEYVPAEVQDVPKTGDWKIVLLSDAQEKDVNLKHMIDVFIKSLPNQVEVLNLHEIDIRGGCLGCLRCGYGGACAYKDDMMSIYRDRLLPADAIIFAGAVRDRYLSSTWKTFFDRSFFNGHRPVLQGKQCGFIVSGPLRQIPNLRQILQAQAELGRIAQVGLVSDEYEDSEYITSLIGDFAAQSMWALEEGYHKPATFLGVGGQKMFRDLTLNMKPVFKADYDYYREHGFFDFPYKEIHHRVINVLVPPLLRIPEVRKRFQKEMKPGMIRSLRKELKRSPENVVQ